MDGNTLEWGLFEPNKKQNIVKYKSIAFTLRHVAQVSTGQLTAGRKWFQDDSIKDTNH